MRKICINDYLLDIENDFAIAAASALLEAKDGDSYIYLEKGEYHVYPDKAFEKYYCVSNNDPGLKRIIFPIIDMDNLIIDGGDSLLVLHGRMTSFAIFNSTNISIKNFRIKQERPYFTQATIIDSAPGYVELEVDRDIYPYTIEKGLFTAIGENWTSNEITNYLEYNRQTACVEYDRDDHYVEAQGLTAVKTGVSRFKLYTRSQEIHMPGNIMILDHEKRNAPTIFIDNSRSINISGISVYSSSAMALIAQLSGDIRVEGFNVVPVPDTDFMISANADATHFVNCFGQIRLVDCVFKGQLDDALNVHGIYSTVKDILPEGQVLLELNHEQQGGICYLRKGDSIEFASTRDLQPKAYGKVFDSKLLGHFYILVKVQMESGTPSKGMVVENVTTVPDLHVSNCSVGHNRARGFLISTRGKVLVEKCRLSPGGAGILIAGDANYWFESGRVQDVQIRDNLFINCRRNRNWGKAVIAVEPVVLESPEKTYYHQNIKVTNNQFVLIDRAVLYASDTRDLVLKDNSYVLSKDFPLRTIEDEAVSLKHCYNVDFEEIGEDV